MAESREDARRAWEKLQAYSWEYLPAINVGHFSQTHAWNREVENLSVWNGLYFWNAVLNTSANPPALPGGSERSAKQEN
jgi:hypothetical protein